VAEAEVVARGSVDVATSRVGVDAAGDKVLSGVRISSHPGSKTSASANRSVEIIGRVFMLSSGWVFDLTNSTSN
jgi:hypothetical protein